MVSIVLAGGGTAGHTSPLIATAEQLRLLAPEASIVCVGTPKGLESRVIPEAGLDLRMIPPVPLPRRVTPELLAVPFRLLDAVRKARRILTEVRAEVVVGFGGYVSLPVYLAAVLSRTPIVLHEQNAVPGLANRIAARLTSQVAVTFPGTRLRGARHVGLPVRTGIAGLDRATARDAAREALGLANGLPVLLVSGGSQGARSINTATRAALPGLLADGINVLHVLGPANLTEDIVPVSDAVTGARYQPVAYVSAMEQAYAAADVMVGRSGAGTVMETAMIGLPTVFVPLPHGNGEQARNADFLLAADAARLVPDAELTGERLLGEVRSLFDDPGALAAMSATARGLVPADAAATLARLVLAVARREG